MEPEYIDESGEWIPEIAKATQNISRKTEWILTSKPGEYPEVRVSKDGKMEMVSTDVHPNFFHKYYKSVLSSTGLETEIQKEK
jgi:hypothetical protein